MTQHRYYCQKAFIVRALQYTQDNLAEVLEFTGKHPKWDKWFKSFDDYAAHVSKDNNQFKIIGPGGSRQIARLGDYIIVDNTGVIYVINPVAFKNLYHPI